MHKELASWQVLQDEIEFPSRLKGINQVYDERVLQKENKETNDKKGWISFCYHPVMIFVLLEFPMGVNFLTEKNVKVKDNNNNKKMKATNYFLWFYIMVTGYGIWFMYFIPLQVFPYQQNGSEMARQNWSNRASHTWSVFACLNIQLFMKYLKLEEFSWEYLKNWYKYLNIFSKDFSNHDYLYCQKLM